MDSQSKWRLTPQYIHCHPLRIPCTIPVQDRRSTGYRYRSQHHSPSGCTPQNLFHLSKNPKSLHLIRHCSSQILSCLRQSQWDLEQLLLPQYSLRNLHHPLRSQCRALPLNRQTPLLLMKEHFHLSQTALQAEPQSLSLINFHPQIRDTHWALPRQGSVRVHRGRYTFHRTRSRPRYS